MCFARRTALVSARAWPAKRVRLLDALPNKYKARDLNLLYLPGFWSPRPRDDYTVSANDNYINIYNNDNGSKKTFPN